jgi:hypothetical protein
VSSNVGQGGRLALRKHLRYDELHAMIEKHGQQIDNLTKPGKRERH